MGSLVGLLLGKKGLQGVCLLPKDEEGTYQALGLLMRIKPELDAFEEALREKLCPNARIERAEEAWEHQGAYEDIRVPATASREGGRTIILRLVLVLLRLELRRLGRQALGPFDPVLSARIDRVVAALEALRECS